MDIKIFTEKFYEKYGNRSDKPVPFFSPGRVNLIGEHTDYNGGFVLPMAINRQVIALAAPSDSDLVRLYKALGGGWTPLPPEKPDLNGKR